VREAAVGLCGASLSRLAINCRYQAITLLENLPLGSIACNGDFSPVTSQEALSQDDIYRVERKATEREAYELDAQSVPFCQ
jgi:hypothetical protein